MRQRVVRAIATASGETGVDFGYLLGKAQIESSLNPAANAGTSSASGLFQFTRQTWLGTVHAHGAEHGLDWAAAAITKDGQGHYKITDPSLGEAILDLRQQPEAAAAMAAELAVDNAAHLQRTLGRPADPAELYLAHFLGPEGASRFINALAANPEAPAAALFPSAAAANRSVFFTPDGTARSLSAIRDSFAQRLANNDANASGVAMNLPPAQWRLAAFQTAARHSHDDDISTPDRTAALASSMGRIEPMPKHLSLDFARAAYQRLAGLDGGAA